MIGSRLDMEVKTQNPISERQYAFMPGRSTTQAMSRVLQIAENELGKTRATRKLCLLVTIDISNAFNSARWSEVMKAVVSKGVSQGTQRILMSYLQDRSLLIEDEKISVTAGVPQGSVLAPKLWNILFDGIFRVSLPPGTELIGYADDLALVVTGKTADDVKSKAEEGIHNIDRWLCSKGLSIAPQKAEAVMLSGRKKFEQFSLSYKGRMIEIKPQIKYY